MLFAQKNAPKSKRVFPDIKIANRINGQELNDALKPYIDQVAAYYFTDAKELSQRISMDTSLYASEKGQLFYVCKDAPLDTSKIDEASGFAQPSKVDLPLDQTFLLHSRPGATKVIYLDFNGHTTSNTIWNNAFNNGANFTTPAFSTDGSSAFSNTELGVIQGIWKRVAEDFSIYDIDVTTQEPSLDALKKSNHADENYGIRAVIGGGYNQWFRQAAGGVAYIGSFSWPDDVPAFVFANDLASGNEKYVADATSHEVGHTLGLSHDGTTRGCGSNGASACGYYSGNGNWAPIMGVGYYSPIVQWSKGEYGYANQLEDDLQVMLNYGVEFITDDHGNTLENATVILPTETFHFDSLIHDQNDVDVYSFLAGTGALNIDILSARPDPNLFIHAIVLDQNQNIIADADSNSISGMNINGDVTDGLYYLMVYGVGQGNPLTTGFSDYGSIGQYTLDATLINPNASYPPRASIVSSVQQGFAPLTVSFNGASSHDPDGVITEYIWDFHDGNGIISGEQVEYTFTEVGIYDVTLIVTDDQGLNAQTTTTITVIGPPKAASNLTVSQNCIPRNSSESNMILRWQDQSFNESGFEIWTSDDDVNYQFVTQVPANATAFEQRLSANATRYYKVKAINVYGDSGFSNSILGTAHQLPSGDLTLSATPQSPNQILLTWTEVQNETGFVLERGLNNRWTQIATPQANETQFLDGNLTKNTAYSYRIKLTAACSFVSAYAPVVVGRTFTTPPVPTGLNAQAASPYEVNLSWNNDSIVETSFELQRATNTRFTGASTFYLGQDITVYNDTNLRYGTTYYYRIRATNAAGASAYSATFTVVTPQVLPIAPSNINASISKGRVTITWTDLSDNEQGFKIERSLDQFVTIERTFNVNTNVKSYVDTANLIQGTNYYYRVRAFNVIGETDPTDMFNIFVPWGIPPVPAQLTATPMSPNQVDLTWVDANGAELSFELQRSTTARFSSITRVNLGSNITAYSDTGLLHGRTYFYRIRAINAAGSSAFSAVISVTTPQILPNAPEGLAISYSLRKVNLSWLDRSDNEQSFVIERSLDDFITIERTFGVGVNIVRAADATNLISGTTYFYRVKARNIIGDSAYSTVVSIRIP